MVKASFPVAVDVKGYRLLKSGAAIGFGVGPRLRYFQTSRKISAADLPWDSTGVNTTANFLWKYFVSHSARLKAKINVVYLNFADVMKQTVSGEIDVGVVIHEGRFVYKKLGLKLFEDLGKYWHDTTGFPVPLERNIYQIGFTRSINTARRGTAEKQCAKSPRGKSNKK